MKCTTVNITSQKTKYKIYVGSDFVQSKIEEYVNKDAFFIVDEKVASLYKNIIPSNSKRVFLFKANEKNKTLLNVEKMLKFLKNNGALRDSTLVAIGGGITGDTAAFTASLYMRGIKLIQIPTTLLSMLDSSVGGKTGVNLQGIKNNIGTFYQPKEVLIDCYFLNSLTNKEYLNGFAEAVKIAAVQDKEFFSYIEENIKHILDRKKSVMEKLILKSCMLKAQVVEQDEKESGIRKLLNFGHTVAHGIESDSKYRVHHGYAVAMGMIYESQYALNNGYLDEETFNQIKNLLMKLKYPVTYTPKDKEKMLLAISKDKKAGKDGISMAVAGSNMQGVIINNVKPKEIIDLFY